VQPRARQCTFIATPAALLHAARRSGLTTTTGAREFHSIPSVLEYGKFPSALSPSALLKKEPGSFTPFLALQSQHKHNG
jgi:hypothetical protein